MIDAATGAVRALELVLARLEAAGIPATRDVAAFHPAPLGVLVGLPSLAFRGLAARTYSVPVRAVSADPLNTLAAVDRLYRLADDLVLLLDCDSYAIGEWFGGVNADPLPAVLLDVTVTVEG